MDVWSWTPKTVQPEDILDAMDTLVRSSSRTQAELVPPWIGSDVYLGWAHDALSTGSDFGLDAAVCYAKRAVCRQIDAMLIINHLQRFASNTYPKKMGMLTAIGCDVPSIVHDLIIDPRNNTEHQYDLPTKADAEKAVQLARLFLKATAEEANRKAVISYGWSISSSGRHTDKSENWQFWVNADIGPMLLLDFSNLEDHRLIVFRPKDSELLICPLSEFDSQAAIRLAIKLREYHEFDTGNCHTVSSEWLRQLKRDLSIP